MLAGANPLILESKPMVLVSSKVFAAGAVLIGVGFGVTAGCEDRRYAEPAPGTVIAPAAPGVDVDVNTPAGRVTVDGASSPVAPHRDVKVDVGNGKVEVDVDGKPLVERIRERREERNLPSVLPASP
jgi:hypothetical protein